MLADVPGVASVPIYARSASRVVNTVSGALVGASVRITTYARDIYSWDLKFYAGEGSSVRRVPEPDGMAFSTMLVRSLSEREGFM